MIENTNSLPFLRAQALLETFLFFHCDIRCYGKRCFIVAKCFFFQAISQGRLYVLRYELCDDMVRSPDLTDQDPRRTMLDFLSPIALFASAKIGQHNELVPVAIQMDYEPS